VGYGDGVDGEDGEDRALDGRSGAELVAALRRWQDFGAVWRVLARDGDRVSVGLFRCDGGEEVERFTTDAPEVVSLVSGRPAPGPGR
jgi:hypothetical protein